MSDRLNPQKENFKYKLTLNAIFEALKIASKHEGRIFGGFVRDVIVPITEGNYFDLSFKDVDLWFTSQNKADDFVKEMGDKFLLTTLGESQKELYRFCRTQYHLVCYGFILALFDIIISETIPVNDFDVNMLTYQIDKNGKFQVEAFGGYSKDYLIASIKCHTINVMSSYKISPITQESRIERTNNRYIGRNWKIMYRGIQFENATDLEKIFNSQNEDKINFASKPKQNEFIAFTN